MQKSSTQDDFYAQLPRHTQFARMTDSARYHALPDDWFVGVSDVVNSTGEVAAGRYKTVNMVGAAVISAVINAHKGQGFPFVFGGDGASLAVAPEKAEATKQAMSAVQAWARRDFDIGLRVAQVPVSEVRAAGQDVRVARFQVSDGADYAMFSGGGLSWAENQMKAGYFSLPEMSAEAQPDLTGLSCRWSHMAARQGTILSLVVAPVPGADAAKVAAVFAEVITLAEALERGGHPAPAAGMEGRWPPAGAKLEAYARRGTGSLLVARSKALLEASIAWILIRTGAVLGGFDARRFARVVAANADFRKLDDGLKMTLDCNPKTQERLEQVLTRAAGAGLVRYGIATQDEAMMTCIVPSIMTDDHLHFIDGAAGGYTQAASRMKAG